MTGLDHMFLSLDSATTNAVLGGLVKYEAPEPGGPLPDATFLTQRLTERIPLIPPMSKRMVPVPLALDHHYLANDTRIDVASRIRTVRVPEPGTDVELAAEVSRIMATPFPTDDVLWDMTVIEGLAGGAVANLLRIHHAVVDGSTMPQIWDLFSDEPAGELPTATPAPNLPEPYLGGLEMAGRALVGFTRHPLRGLKFDADLAIWAARRWSDDGWTTVPGLVGRFLPGPAGRAIRGIVNWRQRRNDRPEITPYMPGLYAPEMPFNGRASAQRHFVLSDMDLAEVKAVGKAAGTTLNNAVVTIVAGALRRYLLDLGVEPDEPIVVCVPVSLRHEKIKEPWSNHVHMMFAHLPVHLADPLQRLEVVTDQLTRAKASFDGLPTHLIRDGSRFIPRDLFVWLTQAWLRLPSRYSRAPWNVVVSNVRGPSRPATMNGLKVAGYWPASFMSIGGGINITLQSYVDRICFGFIGAPEMTGDLWPLVGYMDDSLRELQSAVGAVGADEDAADVVRPMSKRGKPAARRTRSASAKASAAHADGAGR
jgi:diacylglycerol O-acyltransferase